MPPASGGVSRVIKTVNTFLVQTEKFLLQVAGADRYRISPRAEVGAQFS